MKSEAQRIIDAATIDRVAAGTAGYCSACGHIISLRRRGVIRQHKRETYAGTFMRTEWCPGAGRPPKIKTNPS